MSHYCDWQVRDGQACMRVAVRRYILYATTGGGVEDEHPACRYHAHPARDTRMRDAGYLAIDLRPAPVAGLTA